MTLKDAEEVGEKLLGEVREERLDELLSSLRDDGRLKDGQPDWFGVPALDRIVNTFARRNGDRCPVVEITSGVPGSGKTHLLYLLAAIAIIPNSTNDVGPAKSPGAVVVLDTDGRFSMERLALLLHHRLRFISKVHGHSDEDCLSVIRNALKHVHVFRPQSHASLITSVQNLPTYLMVAPDHFSSNRALDLVLIDSITSFFWQDKLAEETSRIDAESKNATRGSKTYHNLVNGLRELQLVFDCTVVVTSWGLSPSSRYSRQGASFRPLLPPMWVSFCSLRLVVERDPVKSFAPGMTIDQAKRDAGSRQAIVAEHKFSAWVDQWNRESWSEDTRTAIKASPDNRAFSFRITRENVDVTGKGADARLSLQ